MKVRDIIKIIIRDGWFLLDINGSHRQYIHRFKPGKVVVSGHLGDDLAIGTMKSIFDQAKINLRRK